MCRVRGQAHHADCINMRVIRAPAAAKHPNCRMLTLERTVSAAEIGYVPAVQLRRLIELGRSLRATRRQMLATIELPAALPGILGGMRVGVTLAVVGAIIGGLVSYPLAAAGALLVGLLEAFSSYWASGFKEVIVFTLIIPVLLWRSLTTHQHEEEE